MPLSYRFAVKDAETGEERWITCTGDPHGAVIEMDGCAHQIVLDLFAGDLRVFVADGFGECCDPVAEISGTAAHECDADCLTGGCPDRVLVVGPRP